MHRRRLTYKILHTLLIALFCLQCKTTNKDKEEIQFSYLVKLSSEAVNINAKWDKNIWNNTNAIQLENFMGEQPAHIPKTKVKLRYDENNIYVIFKVADKYIKAVAKETNGRVWEDSCVEFFFSPGPDTERGYFNFEANCKGVFLFQYHLNNGEINEFVSTKDCDKINISHSLERNAELEIIEPLEWSMEYSIPLSILAKYMKVEKPGEGVSWRANFYKCADKTSHPHWLTWAPVDYPRPKFHLPEFFGRLDFK